MRSMTTTLTSATMGKEQLNNSAMQLVKSTTENTSINEHTSTASTTTATSSTKSFTKNAFRFPKRFSLRSPSMTSTSTATTAAASKVKHPPTTKHRHSATSTTTATTATTASSSPVNSSVTASVNTMTITPRSYRRLRSFPLSLRIRTNPSTAAAAAAENSETSAMTSLSPQEGGGCNSSSSSSAASNNSSSSSTRSSSSLPLPAGLRDRRGGKRRRHRRRKKEREAREEDFVVRCTKIVTVQNDGPGEQQLLPQQGQETKTTTADEEEADADYEALQEAHQQEHQPSPQSPSSSSESGDRQGADQQIQPYREKEVSTTLPGYSCATAILQHSYLEMVCGRRGSAAALREEEEQEVEYQQQQQEAISKVYGSQSAAVAPPGTSSSALSSSSSFSTSSKQRRRRIPDDPTVQDSIECVFASQLEEGLPLWDVEEEEYDSDEDSDDEDFDLNREHRDEREHLHTIHSYEEEPINAPSEAELPSPAPLMQSRQKSRTPLPTVTNSMIPSKRRSHPSNNRFHVLPKKNSFPTNAAKGGGGRRKKYQTAKMVHVGTFDPRTNRILEVAETDHNLMEEDPAVRVAPCSIQSPPRQCGTCCCHSQSVPVVPAEFWPQAPLLLRPTPGEDITILGIRKSGQTDHFWAPADGGWWLTPLYELAGKEAPSLPPGVPSMCPHCCLLPINNGNEPVGEALVTDFQTPLFEGSLLVRLRHVDGGATTTNPDEMEYDDSKGYFAGLNRRYQVVIRGKFKKEMPLTSIVAGCVMDRPVGRLPPKWIMKGAVKVLSFFAPQLEVQMDSPRPKTVAPLGSTPQALVVEEVGPQDTLPPLDAVVEEPKNAKDSLLGEAYPGNTSLQRARGRKKAFDKLYAAKSKHPMTKTSSGSKETYYTFEFLQHLVNFQDFSVELGNLLGSLPIAPILAGQPIPIMAMAKEGEQKLWSFDIWHHNLVEGAKEHDAKKQSAGASQ